MNKAFTLFICAGALFTVSACTTLDEPTWVSPARVEVHEEGFRDSFNTATLDDPTLRAIGVNYDRYGNGPMDVAVSYDPQSKTNNKQAAEKQAARIEHELRRNGVGNLRISTSPVTSAGEKSSALVSFPALTARPPAGCGMMPGYTDAQTEVAKDAEGPPEGYQMGCSVETLMAKQILHPADLLGRKGFETNADALRQETVIWKRGYYSATSNPPLKGENLSDTGN